MVPRFRSLGRIAEISASAGFSKSWSTVSPAVPSMVSTKPGRPSSNLSSHTPVSSAQRSAQTPIPPPCFHSHWHFVTSTALSVGCGGWARAGRANGGRQQAATKAKDEALKGRSPMTPPTVYQT
jgi:hypothetical protein